MEITAKNFTEQLDNITKDLKRACFVGFDAEFSAIISGQSNSYRLFDTNEDRYDRLKTVADKMMMTQVGLTMFRYDRDHNTYIATGYTFHLCPQVFGDIDQSFIFQGSTLKFLCKHNFDFNKFIYDGIPYLSKAEEANVRMFLKDSNTNVERFLEMADERQLQEHCSEISKWLSSGDEDTKYLDIVNPVLRYFLHKEIRLRFPGVLTTDSLGNSNKVLIYRDKYVEGANGAPMAILEENLMNHLLGFSQIMALLATHQKPIIGHNIFLDILLLHNQFIGPLPNKYSTFKKNINEMFPILYDTKYISHEMAKRLTFDEVWKSNGLQDLYEFFSEGKCKKLQSGISVVRLSTPFDVKQSYHEAGWDSYCTGYCFVRLGHWAACDNSGAFRPVSPTEKLAVLSPLCNKVNVIRAAIPYMDLVGSDPPSHRPDLLHVKSLKDRVINVGKIASVLAAYGSVDIKPYGSRTALIAASTHYTATNILKNFKDSREYKISKFSAHKHSTTARMSILSGAIITGSLILYYLRDNGK